MNTNHHTNKSSHKYPIIFSISHIILYMMQSISLSTTPEQLIKFLFEEKQILDWQIIAKRVSEEYRVKWTMDQCKQKYTELTHYAPSKNWTQKEEKQLYALHDQFGNRWSIIASHFLGRSDNCVKNHLYSKMRKALRGLNKIVRLCYKKELKQISKCVLYKLTQTYQENSDIPVEQVKTSQILKNILLECEIQDSQIQSHLDYHEEKQLIIQLLEFNRTHRKKSKKEKYESGLNSLNIQKALQKKKQRRENIQKLYAKKEVKIKVEENQNQILEEKLQKKKEKPTIQDSNSQNGKRLINVLIQAPTAEQTQKYVECPRKQNKGKIENILKAQGILENYEDDIPIFKRENSIRSLSLRSPFREVSEDSYRTDMFGDIGIEQMKQMSEIDADSQLFHT